MYHTEQKQVNQMPIYISLLPQSSKKQQYRHQNLGILIVNKGSITLQMDEEKQEICEGQIYIVNCYKEYYILNNDATAYSIQIDYHFIESLVPNIINISFRQPKKEINDVIYRSLLEIITRYNQDQTYLTVYITGMISIILFILLDELSENKKESKTSTSKLNMRALKIMNYLEVHYKEDLSFDDVAKNFNMSSGHFYKIFKEQIGVTPKEYLTSLRLTHVAIDLLETDTTIIDLAFEHGFTNIKSFYTLFKREYGMSPKEYRIKNK